jgi:hypothetical protein
LPYDIVPEHILINVMANTLISIRHSTAGEEWRRNTIIRDSAKRCEIERRRPHLTSPQILRGPSKFQRRTCAGIFGFPCEGPLKN